MNYSLEPKNGFKSVWNDLGNFEFVIFSDNNHSDYYLYNPKDGRRSQDLYIFCVDTMLSFHVLYYRNINSGINSPLYGTRTIFRPVSENLLRFNMVKNAKFINARWGE